jgi:hypothetical protein
MNFGGPFKFVDAFTSMDNNPAYQCGLDMTEVTTLHADFAHYFWSAVLSLIAITAIAKFARTINGRNNPPSLQSTECNRLDWSPQLPMEPLHPIPPPMAQCYASGRMCELEPGAAVGAACTCQTTVGRFPGRALIPLSYHREAVDEPLRFVQRPLVCPAESGGNWLFMNLLQ